METPSPSWPTPFTSRELSFAQLVRLSSIFWILSAVILHDFTANLQQQSFDTRPTFLLKRAFYSATFAALSFPYYLYRVIIIQRLSRLLQHFNIFIALQPSFLPRAFYDGSLQDLAKQV